MTRPRNPLATALDLDDLIDEAVRHPDRAERIKETLRQRVLGVSRPGVAAETASEDASFDLWDNLPV